MKEYRLLEAEALLSMERSMNRLAAEGWEYKHQFVGGALVFERERPPVEIDPSTRSTRAVEDRIVEDALRPVSARHKGDGLTPTIVTEFLVIFADWCDRHGVSWGTAVNAVDHLRRPR